MLVGSDTAISYNINITLGPNTTFPQNLIFYYDEDYENAIYKENNTISINGYIDNVGSQTEDVDIYWMWPYETGITENQKAAANDLDTYWIGKPISVSAVVIGSQDGENSCANQYNLLLDGNGGVIPEYGYSEKALKQVNYGENYGNLPTPVREGYTFLGWSRNLADEISVDNYSVLNWLDRTSSELKNYGSFENLENQNYIRVYGNTSTESIDTMWYIKSKKSFKVVSGTNYTMIFFVRSMNSLQNQYFRSYTGSSDGKTWIEWDNNTKSPLNSNINFSNDGEWHLISYNFSVPNGVNEATIRIGNDYPNIYGPDSYIDIANIQFAEDSAITQYYITSNTIVKSQNNHTLVAKWSQDN